MTRVTHIVPGNKSGAKKSSCYQPKYNLPHMIIPVEDMNWALQQSPAVYKLWGECWRCDPYGSRMMQLNTQLPKSTFMRAKKVLKEADLFVFERKTSITDGRETVCWMVKNLHGARVKEYWQQCSHLEIEIDSQPQESISHQRESNSQPQESISHQRESNSQPQESISHQRELNSHQRESISPQTPSEQDFQNSSVSSQQLLSNSSKELLSSCANNAATSDAPPLSDGGSPEALSVEQEQIQEQQTETINSFDDIKKKNPFLTKSKNPMQIALQPPRRQYKAAGDIEAMRSYFDRIYEPRTQ